MKKYKNYIKIFAIIIVLISCIINKSNYFNSNNDYSIQTIEFDSSNCKDLLNEVKIGESANVDYDRDDWQLSNGYIFYDEIRNEKVGLRNYYLYLNTNTDIKNKNKFVYQDPYTNEEGHNYDNYEYDHIIPINYVHQHGGYKWSEEQKNEYYYNLDNGVCVNTHDNRTKSDSGPSEWMPRCNQKWYCYKWLEIAVKYDITISQEDYDTICKILNY